MNGERVVSVRARDYVAQYVAALSPENREAMDKKNAEVLAGACCDNYPCDCEE